MPWRLSALITVLDRRPPAQSTAFGRSAGTSALRPWASSIGRCCAPLMWPSSHSECSRTSMTATSRPSSSHSVSSCTVICGTDSTVNPSLRHSIMPHCKNPTTSSTPTRASAWTARSRSDGPWASSRSGTPAGTMPATRSPACRAGAVRRIDLDAVVERQEHAVETLPRILRRLGATEIGTPDRSHEQHVAGQHEPRDVAAREVGDQQADRVGGVAGRVGDLDANAADAQLVAVAHFAVLEGDAGGAVHEDRRARELGEIAIARDVVGVRVGLDDVADRETLLRGQAQVLVDPVAAGIDDEGAPGLAAADQVGEAPRLFVQDLLEDHRSAPILPGAPRLP